MEIKRQEIGVTEGRAFHEDASKVGACEDECSGMGGGRVMKPKVWLEEEGCSCYAVRCYPPLKGFDPEVMSPRGLRENPRERCGGRERPSASSLCQYVTLSVRKEEEQREDEGQD